MDEFKKLLAMINAKDVKTTEVNDGCKHSRKEEDNGTVFCVDCDTVNEDGPVVPQKDLIDKLFLKSDGTVSNKALTLGGIVVVCVSLIVKQGYDKYNEYTVKDRRKNIVNRFKGTYTTLY